MKHILKTEWQGFTRNKSTRAVLLLLVLTLSGTTIVGIQTMSEQNVNQQQANQKIRAQWDNMDPKNPHGAAHYGSYVVRPVNPVSAIDPGINSLVGNVLRLEAHKQNESAYSTAAQSLVMSKFGALNPALVLQIILPVLLIYLVYRSISEEREEGRLKVIVMQGVSVARVVGVKVVAYWLLAVLVLLLVQIIQWIIYSSAFSGDLLIRSLSMFIGYALYYFVICLLTACMSLRLNYATGLTTSIAMWVMWTVFFPKVFGSIAEYQRPLPSTLEFQTAMREDRSKGIDGHNPADQRQELFRDSVLRVYNVQSIDSLPINIDGLMMQADEEYGNRVWDKHFTSLYETYQRQKEFYQYSGLINPFASLQGISMGASGSDNIHRIDFLKQAESYRRTFIKMLNDKHAYGGSKSGDWGWKADQAFYQSVPDFAYQPPRLSSFMKHYRKDHIILLIWLVVSSVLLYSISKKHQYA